VERPMTTVLPIVILLVAFAVLNKIKTGSFM
jgi:hypothetical protein